MVTLTIDNRTVTVPEGTTILEAARSARLDIPTLCYLKDINEIGACRICMVEVEGEQRLVAACDTQVADGIVVHTNSPRVREARRVNLRLLLAQHDIRCPKCTRSGNCKLQQLTNDYNLLGNHYIKDLRPIEPDFSTPVVRFENRCIRCMRCIQVCDKIQGMHIWDLMGTGTRTTIGVSGARTLADSDCTFCGQCITHCPVGGLQEHDDTGKVFDALADPNKITVVQMAPAVRSAWAEYFHLDPKYATAERMVTALKTMGFDFVFDTNFAADLTIMEEGSEFIERFTHRNKYHWPMFTSCCPAWVRYLEFNDPKYLKNISTCKSPMEMFAAVIRDKYAAKDEADGRTTYNIAIMPCTAKKMEAARPEFIHDGRPDVDLVLTTRELVDMMRETGVQLNELELESPDLPFGLGSGAAVIYGVTGGVAEAVVRHCLPDKSKNTLRAVRVTDLRGDGAIRHVELNVDGQELHIAVVNGLVHAKELIADMEAGKCFYHLVEVMTCQGGCVGGAGQPYGLSDVKKKRGEGLYTADASAMFKRAEKNPIVTAMLKEYGEERCHELLHVHYGA